MKLPILDARDVAEYQMCTGCGACAYIAPDELEMVDVLDHGRRPQRKGVAHLTERAAAESLAVCPGRKLEHTYDRRMTGLLGSLEAGWGPVLEVWEGHAADGDLRFAGSSGGAASALAVYGLERGGMEGVLHIGARRDVPYLNQTVLSRTREEVFAATGSRYAPASPCDGLQMVQDAAGPCVFIGKPCDVAGANKAASLRPVLAEKLGVTIALFCAATPTTRGTLELMKKMGVDDPSTVTSIRYRGNGWPGKATVTTRDGAVREMSYADSWGDVLSRHAQWRCRLCPDHTGEFADISVGDPWYRQIPPGETGRSMVLVRTQRGRDFVRGAMAAGYLTLERADPAILAASQPNLLEVRAAVWGRLLGCRWMGAAVPEFVGMPMFRFWMSVLGLRAKVKSVLGTMRRVSSRKIAKRVELKVRVSSAGSVASDLLENAECR